MANKKINDLNYKGAFFFLLWLFSLFGCIGWIVGAIQEKKPYFIIFSIIIIVFNIFYYILCDKYDERNKKNE